MQWIVKNDTVIVKIAYQEILTQRNYVFTRILYDKLMSIDKKLILWGVGIKTVRTPLEIYGVREVSYTFLQQPAKQPYEHEHTVTLV